MNALEILENQRRKRNMDALFTKFPYLKNRDNNEVLEYLWLRMCRLEAIIEYAKHALDTGDI